MKMSMRMDSPTTRTIVIIAGLLVLVLLISGLVYWTINYLPSFFAPTSTDKPQQPTDKSPNSPTMPHPSVLPPVVLPPPPPDVNWSQFNQQLLQLEREREGIIKILMQKYPPVVDTEIPELPDNNPAIVKPNEYKSNQPTKKALAISRPQKLVIPESNTSWAHIAKQILELEQRREETVNLLVRRLGDEEKTTQPENN